MEAHRPSGLFGYSPLISVCDPASPPSRFATPDGGQTTLAQIYGRYAREVRP
jgi:hypothetical protein